MLTQYFIYTASDEFQMAYLYRRASELDKVIEAHESQLDIIIQAMNMYKNEMKSLTEDVCTHLLTYCCYIY